MGDRDKIITERKGRTSDDGKIVVEVHDWHNCPGVLELRAEMIGYRHEQTIQNSALDRLGEKLDKLYFAILGIFLTLCGGLILVIVDIVRKGMP